MCGNICQGSQRLNQTETVINSLIQMQNNFPNQDGTLLFEILFVTCILFFFFFFKVQFTFCFKYCLFPAYHLSSFEYTNLNIFSVDKTILPSNNNNNDDDLNFSVELISEVNNTFYISQATEKMNFDYEKKIKIQSKNFRLSVEDFSNDLVSKKNLFLTFHDTLIDQVYLI